MIESSNYTSTLPSSPCIGCKRKNCTQSVFYGKSCEFAVYHDYSIASGYEPYKPLPYIKKHKHKKKAYRRGKF